VSQAPTPEALAKADAILAHHERALLHLTGKEYWALSSRIALALTEQAREIEELERLITALEVQLWEATRPVTRQETP